MRMHWKMSNDVMAVVEHLTDAREARADMVGSGQKPRDKARDASSSADGPD